MNQWRQILLENLEELQELRAEKTEQELRDGMLIDTGKLGVDDMRRFLVEAMMMLAEKDSGSGDWLD